VCRCVRRFGCRAVWPHVKAVVEPRVIRVLLAQALQPCSMSWISRGSSSWMATPIVVWWLCTVAKPLPITYRFTTSAT